MSTETAGATPPAATPGAARKTENGVKTIQLTFETDDEKKLYDQIGKDADADDRKAHKYLLRWLKQHYKAKPE